MALTLGRAHPSREGPCPRRERPVRSRYIVIGRRTDRLDRRRREPTMGHHRSWGPEFEALFKQHGPQGRRGGEWGGWQWGPPNRRSGPPPWLTGLFGLAQEPPTRGPRVRRGDVRVAILAVLADGPLNGYQVIQEIADRTDGAWRPSPGSVYPTISQLEDEGLVEGDDERGRRNLRLSDSGRSYLADHEAEVTAVRAPFPATAGRTTTSEDDAAPDFTSLKPEI